MIIELTQWITKTAWVPQPKLSLAAALSLVGVLKGNRAQSEEGIRTNLYILSIAPCGVGKRYPQDCIEKILIDLRLDDLISGGYASMAGLADALCYGQRNLYQIRHYIQEQKKILAAMAEISSAPLWTPETKKYREPIHNPHLNINASIYPAALKRLSKDFIKQCLIIDVTDFERKSNRNIPTKLPKEIYKWLQSLNDMSPRVVEYTQEAREFAKDKNKTIIKIALILCDDKSITLDDLKYAESIYIDSPK